MKPFFPSPPQSFLIFTARIDAELPLTVDDEYWFDENGEELLVQPPGKPSTVDAFIYFLKLLQVVAFSLRTVVCFPRYPRNRAV